MIAENIEKRNYDDFKTFETFITDNNFKVVNK